jgi:hypothetical protein
MNLVRLPRSTDVRSDVKPCLSALKQVWTHCQVGVDPNEADFMSTERREQALTRRLGFG